MINWIHRWLTARRVERRLRTLAGIRAASH